jgi:hypothetical protein
MSAKRQNLSPKAWIWYWRGAILLAVAIGIFGVATEDARMIFLGVAMIVVAVGLIAWYRRLDQSHNGGASSN